MYEMVAMVVTSSNMHVEPARLAGVKPSTLV